MRTNSRSIFHSLFFFRTTNKCRNVLTDDFSTASRVARVCSRIIGEEIPRACRVASAGAVVTRFGNGNFQTPGTKDYDDLEAHSGKLYRCIILEGLIHGRNTEMISPSSVRAKGKREKERRQRAPGRSTRCRRRCYWAGLFANMRITCARSGTAILSDAQRDRTNANCLLLTGYLLPLAQHFSVIAKRTRSTPLLRRRRRRSRGKRTILIKSFLCSLSLSLLFPQFPSVAFGKCASRYNQGAIKRENGDSRFYCPHSLILLVGIRSVKDQGGLSTRINAYRQMQIKSRTRDGVIRY